MSVKPRGGVVEEEIPVKTQYNSCGKGWETLWELRVEVEGYLLDRVLFTCDDFFEFGTVFCGKPLVAIRWLISNDLK